MNNFDNLRTAVTDFSQTAPLIILQSERDEPERKVQMDDDELIELPYSDQPRRTSRYKMPHHGYKMVEVEQEKLIVTGEALREAERQKSIYDRHMRILEGASGVWLINTNTIIR
jgi:hypothetical protein